VLLWTLNNITAGLFAGLRVFRDLNPRYLPPPRLRVGLTLELHSRNIRRSGPVIAIEHKAATTLSLRRTSARIGSYWGVWWDLLGLIHSRANHTQILPFPVSFYRRSSFTHQTVTLALTSVQE
jgi:hypothetical protein